MGLELISAGIGAVGSIAQAITGARQSRQARQALENYQRQELVNVTEGEGIYRKDLERQREEIARLGSSAIDALGRGGSRNLIAGIGRVGMQQEQAQRGITDIEGMRYQQLRNVRMEDQARIRAIQEGREQQDINALSSQFGAGQQMLWSGIGGLAQAGMSGIQMYQDEQLSLAKMNRKSIYDR